MQRRRPSPQPSAWRLWSSSDQADHRPSAAAPERARVTGQALRTMEDLSWMAPMPVDLAVDVVIVDAGHESDIADLGPGLDAGRAALDLQALDHHDRVAVSQDIADRILGHPGPAGGAGRSGGCG